MCRGISQPPVSAPPLLLEDCPRAYQGSRQLLTPDLPLRAQQNPKRKVPLSHGSAIRAHGWPLLLSGGIICRCCLLLLFQIQPRLFKDPSSSSAAAATIFFLLSIFLFILILSSTTTATISATSCYLRPRRYYYYFSTTTSKPCPGAADCVAHPRSYIPSQIFHFRASLLRGFRYQPPDLAQPPLLPTDNAIYPLPL